MSLVQSLNPPSPPGQPSTNGGQDLLDECSCPLGDQFWGLPCTLRGSQCSSCCPHREDIKGLAPGLYSCWFHTFSVLTSPQNQGPSMPSP